MLRSGIGDVFTRRPALPLAMALVIGIVAEPGLPQWTVIWIVVTVLLAVTSILTFRKPLLSSLSLFTGIALLGVTLSQIETYYFAPSHISAFLTQDARLAQLELRVLTTPQVIASAQQNRPMPAKQFARAEVLRVKTRSGWQTASGEVSLTLDQPHALLAAGQDIRVIGMLQRPAIAMNPGQFDAAAYYRRQRMLATVIVSHVDGIELLVFPLVCSRHFCAHHGFGNFRQSLLEIDGKRRHRPLE